MPVRRYFRAAFSGAVVRGVQSPARLHAGRVARYARPLPASPAWRWKNAMTAFTFPPACGSMPGHAPEGLASGDVVVEWDGEPVGGMRIDSAVTAPGRHRMAGAARRCTYGIYI